MAPFRRPVLVSAGVAVAGLFEDLRAAHEEMLRMNAGPAWWPGQRPPFVPIFWVPAGT